MAEEGEEGAAEAGTEGVKAAAAEDEVEAITSDGAA
jgi:hypothetical protein